MTRKTFMFLMPLAWLGFAYGLVQRLWQYHGRGWWAARPAIVPGRVGHLIWLVVRSAMLGILIGSLGGVLIGGLFGWLLTPSSRPPALGSRDISSDKAPIMQPMSPPW